MSERHATGTLGTPARWRGWLLGWALALLAGLAGAAPLKNLRFEQLGIEQGLPHELVQALLQDRQGFMWIGTQSGLVRYDGARMLFHRRDADKPGSLTSPWVTALHEDGHGLWVGTRGGGLQRYDPVAENFIPYRRAAKDSRGPGGEQINVIKGDGAAGMWLATGDGLAHFDPDSGRFEVLRHDAARADSLAHNQVQALAPERAGTLWVGTAGGLERLDAGSGRFKIGRAHV